MQMEKNYPSCIILIRTLKIQHYCWNHAGIWHSQIGHYWLFVILVNQGHVLVTSHQRKMLQSPSSCHVLRADVIKQFILPFPELSTFKGFVLHTAANTFAACISHLQYLDPVTIKLLTFGASYNYLLLVVVLMGIVLSFLSSFPEYLRGL